VGFFNNCFILCVIIYVIVCLLCCVCHYLCYFVFIILFVGGYCIVFDVLLCFCYKEGHLVCTIGSTVGHVKIQA